jgi:hypothetical protein
VHGEHIAFKKEQLDSLAKLSNRSVGFGDLHCFPIHSARPVLS